MSKYRVYDIEYDTSGTDQDAMEGCALPSEMIIDVEDNYKSPEDIMMVLMDKISDITHFCVFGLEYKPL